MFRSRPHHADGLVRWERGFWEAFRDFGTTEMRSDGEWPLTAGFLHDRTVRNRPIADMHAGYEAIVSQDPFAPDNLRRVLDSFDYIVHFTGQEPCPEQDRQSVS